MKNVFFLSLLATAFLFTACDKDDDSDEHGHTHTEDTKFEYHAHINSPADESTIKMGETLNIKVDFESHTGETVHNVQVRIFEKGTDTELYNSGADHVHAETGEYEFTLDLPVTAANGFTAHTDYELEATVYGHENREGEESSVVGFHVHPE